QGREPRAEGVDEGAKLAVARPVPPLFAANAEERTLAEALHRRSQHGHEIGELRREGGGGIHGKHSPSSAQNGPKRPGCATLGLCAAEPPRKRIMRGYLIFQWRYPARPSRAPARLPGHA